MFPIFNMVARRARLLDGPGTHSRFRYAGEGTNESFQQENVPSMLVWNKCDLCHKFLIKVLKILRTPSNIINIVVSSPLRYTVAPRVNKVRSCKSGRLKPDKPKLVPLHEVVFSCPLK